MIRRHIAPNIGAPLMILATVNIGSVIPLWPGVALSLTVFGANMLGDALRDLLDPRLRGSG